MAVFNVQVPVIARLDAATGEEATEALARALEAAGFNTYREGIQADDAFLDECQDDHETLPDHRHCSAKAHRA